MTAVILYNHTLLNNIQGELGITTPLKEVITGNYNIDTLGNSNSNFS